MPRTAPTIRRSRRCGVAVHVVAWVIALSAASAAAPVDVTGRWHVTWYETSFFGMSYEGSLALTQSGSTLTVVQPSRYDDGTIDPLTGAFHLDGTGTCFNIFTGMTTLIPWRIDAVAAMDGETFSGTFEESVQPTLACLRLAGTVEGQRLPAACGDGVVGAGDACDDGPAGGVCCTEFCTPRPLGTTCPTDGTACTANATCDGAGGCVQHLKPVGALCRLANGPCDTAEVCTGTSSACPPPSSPTEPDLDGDGVLDPCDDCVGVAPLESVRLRFGRVGVGSTRDFVSLRARVRFAPGTNLPDPRGTWKLVELRDVNQAPVFYAQIPGGPYDSDIGDGWTQRGKRWIFKAAEPVIGAVSKMILYPAKSDPDAWEVKVWTPRGTLRDAVPVPPLALKLIIDGLGPSTRCGQRLFGLPGALSPSCSAPGAGGIIMCR